MEKKWYKSKKFWYAVATAAIGVLKEIGYDIPEEAIYVGIALILGQGLADFGKNKPNHNGMVNNAPVEDKPQIVTVPEPVPQLEKPAKQEQETETMFDINAFNEAVELLAREKYGNVDYSTKFNAAKIIGMTQPAISTTRVIDYWNYLKWLAEEAFTEVWGYSYDEAQKRVAEPGCPTAKSCGGFTNLRNKAMALGQAHYGAYLDLVRTMDIVNRLNIIADRNIDWRKKLYSQHHSLYYVGELARYLI